MIATGPAMTLQVRDRDKVMEPHSLVVVAVVGSLIFGTRFSGATGVSFGGTAATTFTIDSATQITATARLAPPRIPWMSPSPSRPTTSATGAADRFRYHTSD